MKYVYIRHSLAKDVNALYMLQLTTYNYNNQWTSRSSRVRSVQWEW